MDSSGPSSGTTTTEMLSPVRDLDSDLSKPKNLTALNNELTKINSRRDSTVTVPPHDDKEEKQEKVKSPSDSKVRRISRFKVSVVTEPDQSKLVLPDKKEEEKRVGGGVKEEGDDSELKVAKDIIDNTMQKLQDNLCNVSYQQGMIFFFVYIVI